VASWINLDLAQILHRLNFYVDTLGFTHVMGMVGKDGQL
jgi:hypothetical protein